ncbi:MAG: dUTPase [Aurantimicrobium sp.]|uniref:dUTPase n=1 Tax=Aurantimicrobium sp. TaxID=1930784 RepID=UPI002FC64376
MSLQYFLDQQSDLQRVMEEKNGSPHPTRLFNTYISDLAIGGSEESAAALIKMMQWNDKALIHELVEMEAETGWKPWAKSRHINLQAARGEFIDMFHFMLNAGLLLGMDETMIKEMYDAKHAKNEKRQNEDYDGVSTKCPGCNRALDDDAVDCHVREGRLGTYTGPLNWCAVLGRQFIPDAAKGSGR